jgi:hypothetical protein
MSLKSVLYRLLFGTTLKIPTYPRWPDRGEVDKWMRGKIAHYRSHFPDQAYQLFDLSCADYLPIAVHVAGKFGGEELAIYRRLKLENQDLVDKARASTGHRFSRSRICDPEDWPDEGMFP